MSSSLDAESGAASPPPSTWRTRARGWQRRVAASLVGLGWRRAFELHLPTQSLALAAQQILCTAPLVVVFSAVNRHAGGQSAGTVLVTYLALRPAAAQDVGALFSDPRSLSTSDTLLGLIVAALFATGIAATQQRFYELVWGQSRGAVLSSLLRQLFWVLTLCLYLLAVLYAGRAGHGVGRRVHAGRPAGPAVQFGVSFLFFWGSQRLLLGGRVDWRRLVPGAICMAFGLTVLVGLSGLVMSAEIVSEVQDYGLIGATFVLSAWLVVLSGVMFGGALLGQLITQRRSAGTPPTPQRRSPRLIG